MFTESPANKGRGMLFLQCNGTTKAITIKIFRNHSLCEIHPNLEKKMKITSEVLKFPYAFISIIYM